MANPSVLGEICYEAEGSFAEDVDTVATFRLPTVGPVDVSGLVHKKIDSDKTVQYRGEGNSWILGTMEGSFKTKLYLVGHGATAVGAITISALETLLGLVFGNAVTTATSSTLTGGTASVATTADSGTLDAGDLTFIGTLGDTDGEGQCYAISGHSAQNLTFLTDLRGSPQNGAVRYGGTTIYANSSPTATTVSSVRMLLQTANLQYLCHGCFPTAVAIAGLNPGEVPTIEITWAVAWWEYKAATFPSGVSTLTANPAANAAGSLFVNTVGTSTSAIRTYRDFTIEYTLGMETLRGPGGVNQYQDIVGCRRTPDAVKVSWTEDADAATTSPILPGFGTGTNKKHALLTLSTADGSRVAFYFPNLCISNVPAQIADQNLNRLRVEAMAYTGATTTSELTRSQMRMHFA